MGPPSTPMPGAQFHVEVLGQGVYRVLGQPPLARHETRQGGLADPGFLGNRVSADPSDLRVMSD